MHLKAIRIKEELLGLEDYEVGLSIGHLASLYNFQMHRYRDAEKLYFRSMDISKLPQIILILSNIKIFRNHSLPV